MATLPQDKKAPVDKGSKTSKTSGGGGTTNEDMLKYGANMARVVNQKRSK